MEAGLESAMPTYSGGLGVLAGDTLRSAADLGVPMVCVTLLHRKGYFRQHIDAHGNQTESPATWSPEEFLEALPFRVSVDIERRKVLVRAWRYNVRGLSGHVVPVYFLDTFLPENAPEDQALTDYLYGGDERYRLCQEVVLGLGGISMLRALGYEHIHTYHMNEGHSALLTLALLEEQTRGRGLQSATDSDIESVRQRCVFTTHTPVAAGHDRFPISLVSRVLGGERASALAKPEWANDGMLNMTYLGLYFSRYINGVALRHGEVSRAMFPHHLVNAITNGVHAVTWAAEPFARLFDNHIPEWRHDNLYLRYAVSIPLGEVRQAHAEAKKDLLAEVKERTGVSLDPMAFTIGFARRVTAYKRADLLFTDLKRLRRIVQQVGPVQVVYAGKAHPRDQDGKALIRRIHEAATVLGNDMRVVFLPGYDMSMAKTITAGVDIWLNTPQKPREASGTSGMKAALNGVPSLSVLDGWWIEGHVEGVTGWSIGDDGTRDSDQAKEVASLYDKLENIILPMFYERPNEYAAVMRSAIALNGSFFNSQRMVLQYLENAYLIND